jgi:hypothetical protein
MSTPLWALLLPIGISCAALAVSIMTYVLGVRRDEEAREFVIMERHHELITMCRQQMIDVEEIIRRFGSRRALWEIRDSLREMMREMARTEVSKLPTRDVRRFLEKTHGRLALQELELLELKKIVDEYIQGSEDTPKEG